MARNVMLAVILLVTASAQTRAAAIPVNLCEVVASPVAYNGRVLSVEGILSPSEHSLALYSPSCKPKEGFQCDDPSLATFDVGISSAWKTASENSPWS